MTGDHQVSAIRSTTNEPFLYDSFDISLILTVGVIYVLFAWYTPYVWMSLGESPVFTLGELESHATLFVIKDVFLKLPAVLVLGAMLIPRGRNLLREALVDRAPILFVVGLCAVAVRVGLDQTNLLPFRWRSPANEASGVIVGAMVQTKQWLAIGIQATSLSLLAPFIEEVVFRVGLFRWLQTKVRSNAVVIVATSLAFAFVHFGPYGRVESKDIPRFIDIFVCGVILGSITVWRKGRIGASIAVHSALNLTEYITLLVAASRL